MSTKQAGRRARTILRLLVLTIVALLLVGVPLWLVVVNSLKTQPEAAQLSLGLPQTWNAVANYSDVIEKSRYPISFLNSLFPDVDSGLLCDLQNVFPCDTRKHMVRFGMSKESAVNNKKDIGM